MTNTKITRTINTATASVVLFDISTEQLEHTVVQYYTTQKITEKEIVKMLESEQPVKVLKVEKIVYTSDLYEMDVNTFVENAKKIGTGRVTL